MKTVKINEVDYDYDSLAPGQQLIVDHILDLDRKLRSTRFNLDQMQIGRNAFLQLFMETFAEE